VFETHRKSRKRRRRDSAATEPRAEAEAAAEAGKHLARQFVVATLRQIGSHYEIYILEVIFGF